MFDRVAGRYDVLNSVMTAGLHHRWRERAVRRPRLCPATPPSTSAAAPATSPWSWPPLSRPEGHVVGCDFSEPMLDLAREKAAAIGASGVRFEWADALELPYDAASFAAVTVGFGDPQPRRPRSRPARDDPRSAPGGRLVILEITQPRRPPLSTFYSLVV